MQIPDWIQNIGAALTVVAGAGFLIGAGIWWGKFKRLIKRHEDGCPGEKLAKEVGNFRVEFAEFRGSWELMVKVLTKHMAFQLRDVSTPELDLLLDKVSNNRANLEDLHQLHTLLTTEVNEGIEPCMSKGIACSGRKLAACLMLSRVEMLIFNQTH